MELILGKEKQLSNVDISITTHVTKDILLARGNPKYEVKASFVCDRSYFREFSNNNKVDMNNMDSLVLFDWDNKLKYHFYKTEDVLCGLEIISRNFPASSGNINVTNIDKVICHMDFICDSYVRDDDRYEYID